MVYIKGAIYGLSLGIAGCHFIDEPVKFVLLMFALNLPDLFTTVKA